MYVGISVSSNGGEAFRSGMFVLLRRGVDSQLDTEESARMRKIVVKQWTLERIQCCITQRADKSQYAS